MIALDGDSPPGPRLRPPEELFELAYRAHGVAVLGYALRRCADREDALDIVAETFLVAWRKRDQLPANLDDVLPWLFVTARWAMADHGRGERRAEHLGRLLARELGTQPLVPGPEQDLEARARGRQVRAALTQLSDSDRELITLTAWDGLTPAQAGSVLGLTAGTSRVRLHRARTRLRVALSQLATEDRHDDH
ncbi:RNA polymerase sigma factor [Goekera deserti]|uniref:Sigma-70 family RNA polymerase sigma factor n=1 Tax=Goekera deserti TaxID=2497753 RepID=A0A7K3WFB0_9ACTN|nr:sigma-70 family RNA polymerase sigma factor [Goekera deserti]NDI48524.1 sigma-70 family RNA polymerase sigma factor [Goekera deserti]NEL55097.1 sigma-70 family RNA polymerase sigma factor [Goekera deserti]